MYQDLKRIFHTDATKAESVYQKRFSDSSAMIIGLRENEPFFYWGAPDTYKKILAIERLDRKTEELASSLPPTAVNHYLSECMIDEIIITNDIEGVISTRKQVEAALDALRRNDKRQRFQGIVNKYQALATNTDVPLATCEDIRSLYDTLVLEEVLADDPTKAPDGKLFRTEAVRVADAADRTIHENAFSESRIEAELTDILQFYNNPSIEASVRAAIFHFAFAYIHPFYDGNGRTNRFVSSYLLTRYVSRFAGLRLSFSVKENIHDYYKAFTLAEHPLSRGDLTPFILTFLDLIIDAIEKTYKSLEEKQILRGHFRNILAEWPVDTKPLDVSGVGTTLLDAALFTANGLTAEQIAEETHISTPTAHKRLKEFEQQGLLRRTRTGRRVCYQLNLETL